MDKTLDNTLFKEIHITPLLKAADFLDNALKVAKSDLEIAGAIQGFKFCYELAWKTMKRILAYRGIEAHSPRQVFRLSAREDLIGDLNMWFEFIEKRSLTTHAYNLNVANEIFTFLPRFAEKLHMFIANTMQLIR